MLGIALARSILGDDGPNEAQAAARSQMEAGRRRDRMQPGRATRSPAEARESVRGADRMRPCERTHQLARSPASRMRFDDDRMGLIRFGDGMR
jgi:hypothetical protein